MTIRNYLDIWRSLESSWPRARSLRVHSIEYLDRHFLYPLHVFSLWHDGRNETNDFLKESYMYGQGPGPGQDRESRNRGYGDQKLGIGGAPHLRVRWGFRAFLFESPEAFRYWKDAAAASASGCFSFSDADGFGCGGCEYFADLEYVCYYYQDQTQDVVSCKTYVKGPQGLRDKVKYEDPVSETQWQHAVSTWVHGIRHADVAVPVYHGDLRELRANLNKAKTLLDRMGPDALY